jgi:anaerobic magnesium-protoporphyrin IX monomethyl ester cyclase
MLGITVPPLGLASLAAVLEENGHSVRIIDASALGASLSWVQHEIRKEQPNIVGVTSTTPTIQEALAIVEAAKDGCPSAITIVGGPHVTFLPVETLRECSQLDVVCVGEGERTILELTQAIEHKASLSKVRGIVYRSGDHIIKTPPQPLIDDLDSLPFPARHLLPMDRYTILGKKAIIGHLMTSRGCPFNCTFCASSLLFGKRFRGRSPKNVVDEIEQVVSEYDPESIEFSDDEFTLDRKRVGGICDEIRRRGLSIIWACSSRVDVISRELLQKMRAAGCFFIYYGVESGSQRILNLMRKGITMEQVIDAIRWTKEVGIETLASYIIGFPDETEEDIGKTIALAKKLDTDYAQFSLATPYPGTELYSSAKEKGLLLTEDWSQYTAGKPIILNNDCSKEDLMRLLAKAYKSFYLSPRILLRHLRKRHLPFIFRAIVNGWKQGCWT